MTLPIEKDPSDGGVATASAAPRDAVIGVGFVLLSALAFGITPAFVQLAYSARVNAMSLAAYRCLVAAVVLVCVSRLLREAAVGARNAWRLMALGGVLFGPQMWIYFAALQHLDTAITVAIVYAYPAIVAILAAVHLRRLPRAIEMVLLVLALIGIVVIAAVNAGSHTSQLGIVLAAATAVAYAVYVVVADGVVQSLPPIASATWVLLGAGVSTVVVAAALGQIMLPTTRSGWGYVALHGLIIVPIGLGAYYAGLQRLGATRTSIVDTSQPAIAAVVGVTALGERLGGWQSLGIVLITVAVLGLPLAAAGARRRSRAPRRVTP